MQDQRRPDPREGAETVKRFTESAIDAFRTDAPEEFQSLIREYDGHSAVVGLFGIGSTSISVVKGRVYVGGSPGRAARQLAHAATHPETIVAIAEGRTTALEAFHVGDLVVRAPAEELHRAFGLFVRMTEPALRSAKLQGVLREFRDEMNFRDDNPDPKGPPVC